MSLDFKEHIKKEGALAEAIEKVKILMKAMEEAEGNPEAMKKIKEDYKKADPKKKK